MRRFSTSLRFGVISLTGAWLLIVTSARSDDAPVRLISPVSLEAGDFSPDAKEPSSQYQPESPQPAKPPQPYKGTGLRDADFSYLEDPDNSAPYQPFDELKRIHIGDHLRLDLGGEYRLRYHYEDNMRLKGELNDFRLNRVRLYSDLWCDDELRFYVEYLDAVSFGEELPPRPTDEDRSDLLQLFSEIKLCEICDGPLFLRVGRQELYYGSERLISSPDWSNVRRAFEGATLIWRGKNWNIDSFWIRPDVPVDPHNFDSPDRERQVTCLWATYHGIKDNTFDFYYIFINEHDAKNGFVQSITGTPGDFSTNTLGARWDGKGHEWFWEFEGAVQAGEFSDIDHVASMWTSGVGHTIPCLPVTSSFWAYYDFASGDPDPSDHRRETFDQLFPSGHRYLGWQDLVGRQNIRDLNFRFSTAPHDRVEFVAWYHIFHLDEARDNLYNAAGQIMRRSDPNGSDGTDVGQELDLTVTIKVTPRVQWLAGYSHFFSGDYISNSAAANGGSRGDVDFFYSQIGARF